MSAPTSVDSLLAISSSRRPPTATARARNCRAGIANACIAGGFWAVGGIDGGQGEAVRVPFADATLVRVPGSGHSEETMRSLLALSDVMGTGHHAAVSAGVKPGSVVAVDRRRRGGPVRDPRCPAARRSADHRPEPQPGPSGAGPLVRRD